MLFFEAALVIEYIVLASTRHVSKTYENAFVVERFNFDFFDQQCLFSLLKVV